MLQDVVIIGSGIVGSSCAYYLAQTGAKVMLVDQTYLGSGASKAGMTHVATWEGPEVNLELSLMSNRLYRSLVEELSIDFELRAIGGLVVVENTEEFKHFMMEVEHLKKWGVRCQILSSQELHEYEPNLSPHLAGGVVFDDDLQVNPMLATQALAYGAKKLGAELSPFTQVVGIELSKSGDAVEAVLTDKGRIPTKNIVISAGAWSGNIGKMINLDIPVVPRKGTLVVTVPVRDDFLRHKSMIAAGYLNSLKNQASTSLIGSPVIYQTKSGNLVLGSSREFVGFDTSVDPMVVAIMLSRCLRFVPALADISVIRTWAGLRPYSPDLLPIISPVEHIEGVYIATGHEGLGITEGPGTGKLISQMITGQPLEIDLDQLSFARFQKAEHGVEQSFKP